MTEQTGSTTATDGTDSQAQEPAAKFEAITSQEDFDKAIQARIARERAKYADYDQLKADAAELAKLRDAQKTEAERQQEALARAQKELAEERSARLRAEVAASKGVPAELLSGTTQEELLASADALIAFKGTGPRGPVVSTAGTAPESAPANADDWLRSLANQ